jgi:hypothetical protein
MFLYAEAHKQPYTTGEILTLPQVPKSAPKLKGPVMIVIGSKIPPSTPPPLLSMLQCPPD